MISIVVILLAVYFVLVVLVMLGFRHIFNQASDELPREVIEKIAGARYRIVPNKPEARTLGKRN